MTLPYRKKLIEVALPLEAINVASAREKSIRHGHPSTLHLWWARRPLAACRAVLFASLVDDPDSDPAYDSYKNAEDREHATGAKRQQLFDLITELVQWENSNNELVINAARAEIARCVASRKIETGELKKDQKLKGGETVWDLVVKGHGDLEQLRAGKCRLPKAESVNAFLAEHAPPVLDPFCGGGSIPLEAQRLGLRAFGSDLNPVPVLITKALIEIPPKFANMPPVNPESHHEAGHSGKKGNGKGEALIEGGWKGAQGLAEDVRYYGKWMGNEAGKRIGQLYPKVKVTTELAIERPGLKAYVGEELTVIAWLWARTVSCPNPACGLTIPLIKSYALCSKPKRSRRLKSVVNARLKRVVFEIAVGKSDEREGTVTRAGAKCPACGVQSPFSYIRDEGKAGRMSEQLLAIICDGPCGREYFPSNPEHENVAKSANFGWSPDIQMAHNPFSLRPPLYGLETFSALFTLRQRAAMSTFCDLIKDLKGVVPHSAGEDYVKAIRTYSALNVSRLANRCSTACFWDPMGENVQQVFARQAVAMTWDFVEVNPLSGSTGSFVNQVEYLSNVIANSPSSAVPGSAVQRDAVNLDSVGFPVLISTDPPYYDNIDYADLSDFFYVWLRRMLSEIYPNEFSTVLVPKTQELVATPYRFGGSRDAAYEHFRQGLSAVLTAMCKQVVEHSPTTIIYAFKQQEGDEDEGRSSTGWETFLQGAIDTGFAITGTWPLRTELVGNLKGHMNALASSVVLACRKRGEGAGVETRKAFLSALRAELLAAMVKLQRGNIAPVDMAQAAIGPGMAVFTRYAKVIEADGSPMKVRQALALINQTLDEVLAEQEGEFDGDTRWAVAWFEQFGMEEGAFGVAETLSKAKNTGINGLVEAGLIAAKGGKVRLLKRTELPANWDPATDTRLRHWEIVQHLIRVLETGGESAAADLRRKLGGMGDMARDLSYRLYSICERKKWAQDALAYNGLVIAWPEITKLAQAAGPQTPKESQGAMF